MSVFNKEESLTVLSNEVHENTLFQSTTQQQIRVILLTNGEYVDNALCYLEKGWILEFQVGPSLFGKEICLFTNQPISDNIEFQRNCYYELHCLKKEKNIFRNGFEENFSVFAHLVTNRAGTFKYYFTDKKRNSNVLGSGYFIVRPMLSVGHDDKILDINSVQCHTVLAKSLGSFEDWELRLRVSKESGYNMIHFTPVQELGGSNSSYNIKDHLKLNPSFNTANFIPTFEDLRILTRKLKEEWEVLCISDVVLNHAANESPWLLEHPECTYNMETAPHLIPAAILDGYLYVFSKEVASGNLLKMGIPNVISCENHLQAIKSYLESELIPQLRLYEYYMCDIEKLTIEFKKLADNVDPLFQETKFVKGELQINNSFSGRNKGTVDVSLAVKIFFDDRRHCETEEARVARCAENFKQCLHRLNSEAKNQVNVHLKAAVNNCIAYVRHSRVQDEGPKIREISDVHPLFQRYFTGEFFDYESIEKEVFTKGHFIMAHNGWIIDYDPLKNFIAPDSNVYFRRELIAWGDSVKLRYGDSYGECPFLWDYMRKYVEQTAHTFYGIRLDNCHSTSLPAAEYLLDCARRVRPDLFIVAELFTNSDATDNIFVNRLGISMLVREAMSAWNSEELGRLTYRYGGSPVGSFYTRARHLVTPVIAHALFYDMTHDNQSPIEKKSIFDSLASSAVVSMACCASGSTRGFDELVPHHINVVNEKRLYSSWCDGKVNQRGYVNLESGMIRGKKKLNFLHTFLNDEGYSEVFVDQMNENIIAVTRHNPCSHESVILVAYTAFSNPEDNTHNSCLLKKLEFEGVCSGILFEASLVHKGHGSRFSRPENFLADIDYINGLTNYTVEIRENIATHESSFLKSIPSHDSKFTLFEMCNFVPGSIIVLKVCPYLQVKSYLMSVVGLTNSMIRGSFGDVINIAMKLSLGDLNFVLYRCAEEGDEDGFGPYHIPGYGSLTYCGLQGFTSLIDDIRHRNDLGHPFCQNLRQGNWMMDYISDRLKGRENTASLGVWFENIFRMLKKLPKYLVPKYFDLIVSSVTNLLLSAAAFQMSEFVRNGSSFLRALAMGSVQCVGVMESASLPDLSPLLVIRNPTIKLLTMSAGLPHFSMGHMRSWGRDTFIALRGLLLLVGRHEVARCHILGYAGCLRHGLIPNLLNRGAEARYNCRDAVWWWLYSITQYIELVPNGAAILNDPVSRIFPNDDSEPVKAGKVDQPLHSIMQEALSVHFQGLRFRERHAGGLIDQNMSHSGFNNEIGVDLNTGFIYGGNENNCGTWMDKMGSSHLAGNFGQPATPRDGSAVEIVGLSKAVLRELVNLNDKGLYPFDRVKRVDNKGQVIEWTLKKWEDKISRNFELHFWVPPCPAENESTLIHRRGIYRDCYGAAQPWTDYQLRCNFLIALTVAPEMVNASNAWTAITKAEEILLGPLGMKTLDPEDWNYNGNYSNSNDSTNPKVAHGFNYHQGPEWIWPVGYFLRAKLNFAKLLGPEKFEKSVNETRSYLGTHYREILTSHWRGLPELTNINGAYCEDSCRVQAWSMACILEVLYELERLKM